MKNTRKHAGRGEGRLIAVSIIAILMLCALDQLNRLPVKTVVQPVHVVLEDLYDFVLIDVNTASEEALIALPEIGEILAARIVKDREINGPYRSLEDLLRVDGVGPSVLEALKPFAKAS